MDARTPLDLERAAEAGNVQAMTELGSQLLSGSQGLLRPEAGAGWLRSAGERGGGEAHARLAVLAGAGVCGPQSWDAALDHLQRSAELGWTPAQKELAVLAGEDAAADGAADWQRLRRAVDIAALTAVPPKQPLMESPRIRRFEGFASAALCDWMIERARRRLAPARIYDPQSGRGVVQSTRTNSETDFNIVEADLVLTVLRARIGAATALPPAVMELTKVLHYEAGQQFAPHFDFIDPQAPGLAAEIQARGQRLATFLLYLNDDYEGGETVFPTIGLRHRGRRGDALMFANVDLEGRPDRKTLHTGAAPTRGQKWLLSQWIRDRVPAAPGPGAAR